MYSLWLGFQEWVVLGIITTLSIGLISIFCMFCAMVWEKIRAYSPF